jgi:hypothetical protein
MEIVKIDVRAVTLESYSIEREAIARCRCGPRPGSRNLVCSPHHAASCSGLGPSAASA